MYPKVEKNNQNPFFKRIYNLKKESKVTKNRNSNPFMQYDKTFNLILYERIQRGTSKMPVPSCRLT